MNKYHPNLPDLELLQLSILPRISPGGCRKGWELKLARGYVNSLEELHYYFKMYLISDRYVARTLFNNLQIKDLKGINFETDILIISSNPCFKSLSGIENQKELLSLAIIACSQYSSMKDIRKHIPKCLVEFEIENQIINDSILGLLLTNIKTIRFNEQSGTRINLINTTQNSAFRIIRNHLLGERDILDCQEQLITEGLKEYAKL